MAQFRTGLTACGRTRYPPSINKREATIASRASPNFRESSVFARVRQSTPSTLLADAFDDAFARRRLRRWLRSLTPTTLTSLADADDFDDQRRRLRSLTTSSLTGKVFFCNFFCKFLGIRPIQSHMGRFWIAPARSRNDTIETEWFRPIP